jgi:molecular chaperone DnaK
MVNDAESHADDDKKRRENIDIRNQADNLVYSTEKVINENKDKLAAEDIKTVEEALKETKDAIEKGDTEDIKTKMETLNNASHKLAEAMYKNTNAEQPGADPTGGQQQNSAPNSEPQQKSHDNVVDAEFEETDK